MRSLKDPRDDGVGGWPVGAGFYSADMRDAFLEAAESVLPLVTRPEVARAWHDPSALPEWSVGGLAGHLAGQLTTTSRVLATSYVDQELIRSTSTTPGRPG